MIFVCRTFDGEETEFELAEGPVRIGRGTDAGIRVSDEEISRLHCEMVVVAGRPTVRDLGSKNGTFLNGVRIQGPSAIGPEDRINIGNALIFQKKPQGLGTTTAIRSIQDEMGKGKGYKTILREIVDDA